VPTVLVTGAGRGIGRAVAEHLAGCGWSVVAGVRTDADAESIAAAAPDRITPVILDVTDDAHLARLTSNLEDGLDAVVNNAGIAVAGPMETVTTEQWRKQLDVNVIGQLAVTRTVLPRLRERRGRVVFVSSVNAQVVMPMLGAYCASKFALEAAAEALRMELRPWRIAVSVVEPAQTDTDMWRLADDMVDQTEAALSAAERALYRRHIAGMRRMIPVARRMASSTDDVSAVIERALTARRPQPRYVVGAGPRLQAALMTNLPIGLRDHVIRRVAGQP
jgi:NAD(P)-dependent dehydrogenase (short-subunit alcohol dehydrogenase family)